MKNQVIKNLNPEMGKEIIKYFQSLGVDTKTYNGKIYEKDNTITIYYGVIDGCFANYSLEQVQEANAEIIELPSNFPKRGDRILVWDYEEYVKERIFLAYIEGAYTPIITIDGSHVDRFKKGETFAISVWKHWKPIPKEEIIELTLEDISNGKGVGVKPELIRIKK